MKGWVTDIVRGSFHDGPGIRTVVFLQGCPLRCAWCHNPETWSAHPVPLFYPNQCLGCGGAATGDADRCRLGARNLSSLNGRWKGHRVIRKDQSRSMRKARDLHRRQALQPTRLSTGLAGQCRRRPSTAIERPACPGDAGKSAAAFGCVMADLKLADPNATAARPSCTSTT